MDLIKVSYICNSFVYRPTNWNDQTKLFTCIDLKAYARDGENASLNSFQEEPKDPHCENILQISPVSKYTPRSQKTVNNTAKHTGTLSQTLPLSLQKYQSKGSPPSAGVGRGEMGQRRMARGEGRWERREDGEKSHVCQQNDIGK